MAHRRSPIWSWRSRHSGRVRCCWCLRWRMPGVAACCRPNVFCWPRPPFAAAAIVTLCAAFVIPAETAVLPGLDRLWLSRSAAALIAEHPPAAGAPLVAIGYAEPSLVFLLGGHVRLAVPDAAA